MRKPLLSFVLFSCTVLLSTRAFTQARTEVQQNAAMASGITIIRDNWGVPHIYGKTDQHCAFGMMYAQCEDNFWQLEETMIRELGRAAEVYGESELGRDAEVALFECVKKGKAAYQTADACTRSLCDAAAAGINFYINSTPAVQIRLLKYYEPWFFLLPSPVSPGDHGITAAERRKILFVTEVQPNSEGDDWGNWITAQSSGSNALAVSS
ncbi:MAG: penicillin acylase family protein, partial [Chitinophagaceae bacterium]